MSALSFEIFPPRSCVAASKLMETVEVLMSFQPEFVSVTYGAGGTNKDGTLDTLDHVSAMGDVETVCHVTYTGSKPAEIASFANTLWEKGIRRILALRGDSRGETGPEYFANTAQFVQTLKRHHPFEIIVACYPEKHPKAYSMEQDLQILLEKQNAGATSAISQFFFDNSKFYEFERRAREFGITLPLIPGILPIYNFERVKQMAADCGTYIPDFIHEAFEEKSKTGSTPMEIASELLKAQIHDLAYAGYEQIHIYTLNKPSLSALAAQSWIESSAAKQELMRAS